MSAIQHEHTLNPVTALDFYQFRHGPLLLLAGEGLYLKIYNAHTSELLAASKVFTSQTVHGIASRQYDLPIELPDDLSPDRLRVIVWGGRSYVQLSDVHIQSILDGNLINLAEFERIAPDWLLDIAVHPSESSNTCLFISAHGSALTLPTFPSPKTTTLDVLIPASQAIFYSAHVIWTGENAFLLAAGSVFGEVEVKRWKDGAYTHLYTFSGHEGSIFGVQISSSVSGPNNQQTRLLASCSDDRTIRVWDLGSDDTVAQKAASEELVRDTGFGNNNHRNAGDESAAERLLAFAMGHLSRIWKVKFLLPDIHRSNVNILSFGEDAMCQRWEVPSRAQVPDNSAIQPRSTGLKHCETFAFHSGKHLWSTAVIQLPGGLCHVASGGGDSKIAMYTVGAPKNHFRQCATGQIKSSGPSPTPKTCLAAILQVVESSSNGAETESAIGEMVNIGSVSATETGCLSPSEATVKKVPKKKAKKPKPLIDAINRYDFVSETHILATTNFGRVLRGAVTKPYDWTELFLPGGEGNKDLKSYSLVAGIPDRGAAFLIGTNGVLYLYRHGQAIVEVTKLTTTTKVANLFRLQGAGTSSIRLLATYLGNEDATLLHFESSPTGLSLTQTVPIRLPHGFVITSAGEISGLLVIGSRVGNIAVCDMHDASAMVLADPHPDSREDAVTCLTCLPSSQATSPDLYFIATSRTGSYSIYRWTASEEGIFEQSSLTLAHHSSPPLSSIESAWFAGSTLFFSGFRGISFIVWNETDQLEVFNVECGGSHRSFAYHASPSLVASGAGTFVYTKASELHIQSQTTPSHAILKSGGHGREIKACSHLPGTHFFATGGEDTNLKIWKYEEQSLKCITTIQKHTAGIRSLKFSSSPLLDGSFYLFSSSGYEEFHVWRVRRIPGFGLGVVLEASMPLHLLSADRDLRIMSFDAEIMQSQPLGEALLDSVYHITLAYSDSTMQTLRYQTDVGFELLKTGRYTAACLTEVHLLTGIGNHGKLLTASTDGHLAFWSDQLAAPTSESIVEPIPEMILRSRHKLHQNAILGLDILLPKSSAYFYVLTSSDDNAIILSQFECLSVEFPSFKEPSKLHILNAHAAAITGVGFLTKEVSSSKSTPSKCFSLDFWSVGIDQVLKKWTVEIVCGEDGVHSMKEATTWGDRGEIEVAEKRISTADVAGLCVFGQGDEVADKVMIFGAGIEVFGV